MTTKHIGSRLDDFLRQDGTFEDTQTQAIKEVIAWELAEALRAKRISKTQMAELLNTSPTQVDRLLDPTTDVTLSSLQKAAEVLGRKLLVELV